MKTKMTKGMLMTALICGTIVPALFGGASVYAAEVENADALSSFELDPMIVTATKTEMKTLDVAGSVEVMNREKIESYGAGNAFEVLRNGIGIDTHSQSVYGTAMGTMTSRIRIRGVDKGTLVLVNGVRLNQDGKYNLENIPAEAIERIEIVRGGGSVLYGSEATGGVVNIITKRHMKNSVKVEAGNYGRERYSANLNLGKFSAVVNYQNKGKVKDFSETFYAKETASKKSKIYDFIKGSNKSILWNYDINDALTFTHSYAESHNTILMHHPKTGKFNDGSRYENKENTFLLRYDKDGWKAHVSYGTQEKGYDKDYPGMTPYKYFRREGINTSSWRKGHNWDVDVNKSFDIGKNKLLVGASFQREDMDVYGYNSNKPLDSNYKRNVYSIYASFDWNLGKSDNLILNARQTWANNVSLFKKELKTGNTETLSNKNMSKFTPEVQYIHKIADDSRFYAKVGKSFRLPDITKIFGSTGTVIANLDLKPENGTHYELGYKKDFNKGDLRVALFSYKIKDSVERDSGTPLEGNVVYANADVRNTGIEVETRFKHDEHWNTSLGIMYGRPQRKQNTWSDKGANWHDQFERYQLNGSVNYRNGKFNSMLSVVFNGDRSTDDENDGKLKPQCFTDLHLSYAPAKDHKFFFHLNNIFDRKDWTGSASTPDISASGDGSYYYTLGRNFMLGYECSF